MKARTLYIPVRWNKKNGYMFCLDSKGKPRTYNSMKSLRENMPEPFDDVAVYSIQHFIPLKEV